MNKTNKLVIINRTIPGGGKTSLTKQIEEVGKKLGAFYQRSFYR
ncbi:hypothetical protein [Helicobacter pylori]|nr:hypothetical protein [Helicobacter pylori]